MILGIPMADESPGLLGMVKDETSRDHEFES